MMNAETIAAELARIQIERIWLELNNIAYMRRQTESPLDRKRLDATQEYLLKQETRWLHWMRLAQKEAQK